MTFTALDWTLFLVFVSGVLGFALWKARKEETSEDFFLAGRNLSWWLIGISMLAANISTEHFIGMSGRGFELGMAIASYEWMAAVAITLVAWVVLPALLRSGIYTIPEYLEYRFSAATRALMAAYMALAYVFVGLASVLYSGALGLYVIFDLDQVSLYGCHLPLSGCIWIIAAIAGTVMVVGGLKAVAWTDLFCAIGIVSGGVLLLVLGLVALGDGHGVIAGAERLAREGGGRLEALKPWDHREIPWVAAIIGGLWIPQFFYWGLNQFIIQRALAGRSLAEAQKGVLLTACLKLLIPFIIIIPGTTAWILYRERIASPDQAYPFLLKTLLPAGLKGLMLAALFGAVIGALTSMLSALSTIVTMDLYRRHLRRDADGRHLVRIGRILTVAFAVIACLWAPRIATIGDGSVFKYIQTVWGFLSPGIVAAFLFGTLVPRTPAIAATGAMLLGIPIYGLCLWTLPGVAFLHHMALTFLALCLYILAVTIVVPVQDARSEEAPRCPGDALTCVVIPWLSALLGSALLLGPAMAVAGLLLGDTLPARLLGGVAALGFGAAALALLRSPSPRLRRAPAGTASARIAPWPLLVLGAGIIALHGYLFGMWVLPAAWQEGSPLGLGPSLVAGCVLALFGACLALLARLPAVEPRRMPVTQAIDLTPSRLAKPWGMAIIAAVACLYWLFR